jgi:glutamate-1-semialdehyde 2,1-aminomutase
MEVSRSEPPKAGFLESVRKLASEKNIVLIFDECTSGFRETYGGLHSKYGVDPDMAIFGKAMGNGYPVAAFGGRAEVMDAISFAPGGVTHGGTYTANLIALAAARATLTILAETDALQTVARVGADIRAMLGRVFTSFDVEHTFAGPDAMFGVHFSETVPLTYRDWKRTDAVRQIPECDHAVCVSSGGQGLHVVFATRAIVDLGQH